MSTIGDNIRRVRTAAGLTQEEFGRIAGVSNMAVSQWENGRAVPRMGAVQAIADHLGINKGEIIDDAAPMPASPLSRRPVRAAPNARVPVRRLGRVHAGEAVCKAAGCHWTSLKNLRHSHATIMLSAGVDVVTVSRRLGHSSVSVTDRFYLRPRRAADEGAASAFDALGVAPKSK